MKFFGTIGKNESRHFYEAAVEVDGERGEIEIQANTPAEAMEIAKDAGYTPASVKYVA